MEIHEMSDRRLNDELIVIRKRIKELIKIQKQMEEEQEKRFEERKQ
jgi:hypothetical protein